MAAVVPADQEDVQHGSDVTTDGATGASDDAAGRGNGAVPRAPLGVHAPRQPTGTQTQTETGTGTGTARGAEARTGMETASAGEDSAPPTAPPTAAPDRADRRRRRTRRVLLGALTLLVTGVLFTLGTGWYAYEHYTGRVARIPHVFPTGVPAEAQPAPAKGGQTFLLVGIDARSDLPTTGSDAEAPAWRPGAQRSDTMMLVHIPADHRNAYVVSLPRDSWVPIPGKGDAKLNAAFSWGGPPLLIDTVQRLTDVPVDHLAVIDWSGFRKLTDAVGGVDITVDKTVPRRNGGGEWEKGAHHMDGAEALDYVRERYGLPRGDLDRTKRQQNFLRAVLARTLSGGTVSNPLKAKRMLDAVTSTVSVDDRLSDGGLRDLVWSMKDVRPSGMVFMNAPVAGFDMIRGQSVVLLDRNGASALWEAIRNDTMADYVADNTLDRLGTRVS